VSKSQSACRIHTIHVDITIVIFTSRNLARACQNYTHMCSNHNVCLNYTLRVQTTLVNIFICGKLLKISLWALTLQWNCIFFINIGISVLFQEYKFSQKHTFSQKDMHWKQDSNQKNVKKYWIFLNFAAIYWPDSFCGPHCTTIRQTTQWAS
jgi:hypothetical protein